MIKINDNFKSLIPPLTESEYAELEASILAEGCREALITWNDWIVDGHHRYEICTKYNIPFHTQEKEFESEDAAKVWIISNQLARRNISDYLRFELKEKRKDILLERGREKKRVAGKEARDIQLGVLPIIGKTPEEPHDTRQIIADELGWSHSKFAMAELVAKHAPEELKEELRADKVSINEAYKQVRRELSRKEAIEKLNNIEEQQVKEISGVFDVIVIDPPWEVKKIERDVAPNQVEFDYPTMSLEELKCLQIPYADNCHVWLWTTHKYLPAAFELLKSWGLNYVCTFVWHKAGGFQPFDLPQYNCEFALYARRGTPIFTDLKDFKVCFEAPRGNHSEKPEQFYDMVRRVTGGRRLDMFNRRPIEGFETWGKEAA